MKLNRFWGKRKKSKSEPALEDLPEIRFNLGTDLISKIEEMHHNCENKATMAGIILGGLVGLGADYAIRHFTHNDLVGVNLLEMKAALTLGFAECGWLTGMMAGMLYGDYRVKQLHKQYPERARFIKSYETVRYNTPPIYFERITEY